MYGEILRQSTDFLRRIIAPVGEKPSESQKAKALWAVKAATDRRDEFYDSAGQRKHFGKETDKTGVVGRTPQRPNHSVGQSFE